MKLLYPTTWQDAHNDMSCALETDSQISRGGVSGALNCMHDQQAVLIETDTPNKYIVRRLTPLECIRLQGLPDWWTDGVEGSDSAIYRMAGNGIALPCAVDIMARLAEELSKENRNNNA